MSAQCDHREPASATMGGRRLGRRCTRRAKFHAYPKNGEGSGNFCRDHLTQRSGMGIKVEKLPEPLGRCYCTGGDVPHAGLAEHTTRDRFLQLRTHKRCTRSATVKLRRVVTTDGKPNPSADGFAYCAPCAEAIERYQGSEVERL